MRFNKHSQIEGRHALLAPSSPAWLNYDNDKLVSFFTNHLNKQRGVEEHEFAQRAIKLGHRLPDKRKTMNMYINDSIGWRMYAEVQLYWSPWCFGTADAIGFSLSEKILRISDLKTGRTPTKMDQLLVYSGLFCLEYEIKPWDIETELRIYQGNAIRLLRPDPDDVFHAMDRILTGSRVFKELTEENLYAA